MAIGDPNLGSACLRSSILEMSLNTMMDGMTMGDFVSPPPLEVPMIVPEMHTGMGMTYYCNGDAITDSSGNWIGHVWPGLIMFFWGFHWSIGIARRYFETKDSGGKSRSSTPNQEAKQSSEFQSSSTLPFLWFPKTWPVEAYAKTFLPMLAISLELYFAHSGYRYILCPSGSNREGHLTGDHLANWAHTATYPGFIISGIVDLVGLRVALPHGMQQGFLSLAFLQEALVFILHKKHTPLDIIQHQLLTVPMLASSLAVAAEIVYPHSLLVSCGRVVAVMLQGTWFWGIAHIAYEGRQAWSEEGGDLAPAVFAPVVFAAHIVVLLLGLVCVFVLAGAVHTWQASRPAAAPAGSLNSCSSATGQHRHSKYERLGLLDEGEESSHTRELPMSRMGNGYS